MAVREDIDPWYKQFWLWFIIALPAAVVVASIYTVILAFQNEDSLVADDYYKDGMGINQVLAQDDAATALGLSAKVTIDTMVGEVRVALSGNSDLRPESIQMQWFHPTSMKRDVVMTLRPTPDGRYLGQFQQSVSGRWYLQLSAQQPAPWRLKTEVNVDGNEEFYLHSAVSR